MKNLSKLLILVIPMLFTSCVVMTTHRTTGNPIGTKEGYIKGRLLGSTDVGISTAAKLGGITKIGSVDVYYYMSGKMAIKVTGE